MDVMRAKIEFGLTSTAKPTISFKVDEINGGETAEEKENCYNVAWEMFEKMKDRTLKEFGKLKMVM